MTLFGPLSALAFVSLCGLSLALQARDPAAPVLPVLAQASAGAQTEGWYKVLKDAKEITPELLQQVDRMRATEDKAAGAHHHKVSFAAQGDEESDEGTEAEEEEEGGGKEEEQAAPTGIKIGDYIARMKAKGGGGGKGRKQKPSPSATISESPSNPPSASTSWSSSPSISVSGSISESPSQPASPSVEAVPSGLLTGPPSESATEPSSSATPSDTPSSTASASPSTEVDLPTPSSSVSETPAGVSESPSTSASNQAVSEAWPSASTPPTAWPSQSSPPSETITGSPSLSPSTSLSIPPSDIPSVTPSPSTSISASVTPPPLPSSSRSESPLPSTTPSVSASVTPTMAPYPDTAVVPLIPQDIPERVSSSMGERSSLAAEGKAPWTYDPLRGPELWGQLDPSFAACDSALLQSPIDISTFRHSTSSSAAPHFKYTTVRGLVRNMGGKYLRVVFGEGCVLEVGEKQYQLMHAKVHTPSEHTIGGVAFPLEIQYVHSTQDGDVAAVSVLYQQGLDSPFIDRLLEAANGTTSGESRDIPSAFFVLDAIPKDVTQYSQTMRVSYPHYAYDGSLTSPPCTDSVKWFVWAKPDHVSSKQLNALRKMFPGPSNRPIQPLNNRVVELRSSFRP